MSPVTQTRPAAVTAAVKLRKSISFLTPEEVDAYRAAVEGLQGIPDNRGWQYYAGWHGVPQNWCEHHNPLFLPWHRAYLYHLEIALQTQDPNVTIPWWDWMAEDGIPASFQGGDAAGNPLAGGPIQPLGMAAQHDWPSQTTRDPGTNGEPDVLPPPLQSYYDWVMQPTDFLEFSRRCWMLHDNVHVWVGGTMSDPQWAAYDPIFFSHHCMVDRLWRIWQVAHPGASPPAQILDASLRSGKRPVFSVREVLEVQPLGYDYAGASASVQGTIG
jgi:tyrosinase